MSYDKSIFIFHRSLRLHDNVGLIESLKDSEKVIPIFIFTPEQITDQNKFKSNRAIRFMVECLEDVNNELKKYGSKLFLFYGKQEEVIEKLIKADNRIQAVFVNEEYTKYGVEREKKLIKVCNNHDVELVSCEDYLLLPPNSVETGSGSFYSKFTPFYNNAVRQQVEVPLANRHKNYMSGKTGLKGSIDVNGIRKLIKKQGIDLEKKDEYDYFKGTRTEGKKRINAIKDHKAYPKNRNLLNSETTRLSPYIKFGIVSIREVYHKIKGLFGVKHDLIKQLFWREFYYLLAYNRQDIFKGKSFKGSYDKITWNSDAAKFKKWKEGKTGFPIVDAGMRELNETGYMHNRARLITSNFLIKLLGIDWRKGEKYYATKLIDYDPSVNNGNWQWSSGSGADSQPYFRIFNPWTQSKKFDNDGEYIKKWVPELKDVDPDDLHKWDTRYDEYKGIGYYKPCIDYNKARTGIKKIYKKAYS